MSALSMSDTNLLANGWKSVRGEALGPLVCVLFVRPSRTAQFNHCCCGFSESGGGRFFAGFHSFALLGERVASFLDGFGIVQRRLPGIGQRNSRIASQP